MVAAADSPAPSLAREYPAKLDAETTPPPPCVVTIPTTIAAHVITNASAAALTARDEREFNSQTAHSTTA
jgi:hypothetical protein